jgi:glycerol kinase
MDKALLLAIDQGTTSTRTILFDAALAPLRVATRALPQHFPSPGWVEHDADDIWAGTLATLREAAEGVDPAQIAGIGITNQRETTLLWERATGRAVARAIVWQDRRTADHCARLVAEGAAPLITERTGLLPDPYFSATKLAWLLDTIPGVREAAARGALCFGTVDSFLLFRLTGGRVHATDASNASRTMLFDIHRGCWDEELLQLFDIPAGLLPEIRDNACEFGVTDAGVVGFALPIRGMAGDQQAAMMGQACFAPGMVKSTYGTGCFALMNTGATAVASHHRLLTTVAWQLRGSRCYALEGAIFVAGAALQWLRDGLGIIAHASDADALARQADPAQRVVLVPGFTGLGAPWWDAGARGAILGLTRGTGRAEIVRAALESVGHQTRDLIEAMEADWPGGAPQILRVDGGMVASDWTMQFLADLLGMPVDRPTVLETTAMGAAWLAGLQAGLMAAPGEGAAHWRLERRFLPMMARTEADERQSEWRGAVRRVLSEAAQP